MSISYPKKEYYTMDDLLEVIKLLRSPEGCPWDRVQTHDSIRSNFIEETYEAVEAIDNNDMVELREELGDVLMQILLHASMEEEKGVFTFSDVANDLCQKLIIRHPHVFGDVSAKNEDEALQSWDAAKRKTKNTDMQTDLLRHVPKSLPALMVSEKVQSRARRVGFDYEDVSGAYSALENEIAELKNADNKENIEEELGDVLFSIVNVSRFLEVDAEKALLRSTEKFIRRFEGVEKLAHERNINMSESTIQELDELWNEVKENE